MIFNQEIVAADVKEEASDDGNNGCLGRIQLRVREGLTGVEIPCPESFDFVFVATGYSQSAHEAILRPLARWFANGERHGLPQTERDYRIKFHEGIVSREAGVWLQGCCEESHGVSLSLLGRFV